MYFLSRIWIGLKLNIWRLIVLSKHCYVDTWKCVRHLPPVVDATHEEVYSRSRWRPNERYHCIWYFTRHQSEGNWIMALEFIQTVWVSWHSFWSKMPFTSTFRPIVSNSSNGCNKGFFLFGFCFFSFLFFFCLFFFLVICFIVGVKVVSMAMHFVEHIIQTILEVKAVCLDTDSSCKGHSSHLTHYQLNL